MSSNGTFNSCRFNRHYRISFKIIIRVNLSELAKPFQQGSVTVRSISFPATFSSAVAALAQDEDADRGVWGVS